MTKAWSCPKHGIVYTVKQEASGGHYCVKCGKGVQPA